MLKIWSPSAHGYVDVYEKSEADDLGLEYVHWTLASKGQFAITDDDYVFTMIGVVTTETMKAMTTQTIKLFKTPWGIVKYNSRYPTKKFRCFGATKPIRELHDEKIRRYLRGDLWKDLAMVYSLCFDADIALHYVCPDLNPALTNTYKLRMRTNVFKEMVMENVKSSLEKSGIDQVWVLDQYREVVELAKKKQDYRTLATILDTLSGITGLKDKKVAQIGGLLTVTERLNQLKAAPEGAEIEQAVEVSAEGSVSQEAELVRPEDAEVPQETTDGD